MIFILLLNSEAFILAFIFTRLSPFVAAKKFTNLLLMGQNLGTTDVHIEITAAHGILLPFTWKITGFTHPKIP